jgi:hypothetical protein
MTTSSQKIAILCGNNVNNINDTEENEENEHNAYDIDENENSVDELYMYEELYKMQEYVRVINEHKRIQHEWDMPSITNGSICTCNNDVYNSRHTDFEYIHTIINAYQLYLKMSMLNSNVTKIIEDGVGFDSIQFLGVLQKVIDEMFTITDIYKVKELLNATMVNPKNNISNTIAFNIPCKICSVNITVLSDLIYICDDTYVCTQPTCICTLITSMHNINKTINHNNNDIRCMWCNMVYEMNYNIYFINMSSTIKNMCLDCAKCNIDFLANKYRCKIIRVCCFSTPSTIHTTHILNEKCIECTNKYTIGTTIDMHKYLKSIDDRAITCDNDIEHTTNDIEHTTNGIVYHIDVSNINDVDIKLSNANVIGHIIRYLLPHEKQSFMKTCKFYYKLILDNTVNWNRWYNYSGSIKDAKVYNYDELMDVTTHDFKCINDTVSNVVILSNCYGSII